MTKPAAISAVFIRARQVRDEVIFEFSMPAERATDALARLGGYPKPGESRWFIIARLNPETVRNDAAAGDAAVVEPTVAASPSLKDASLKDALTKRRITSAGIRCKDPLFQQFLNEEAELGWMCVDERTTVNGVHHICRVQSRKELLPNTEAGNRWDLLEDAFINWREKYKVLEQ